MKRFLLVLLAAGAFVAGSRLAAGAPRYEGVPEELLRRHKLLAGDLEKIRRAARDLNDIRRQIEEGFTYLNETEQEMQREGRKDFHIFMERARNDTLETLALYDRILKLRTYVDPLEKLFGERFDRLVQVEWRDTGIDTMLEQLSEAYGVTMVAKGDVDRMKLVSLSGEMSLESILYYIESQWDVRATVKGKEVRFEKVDLPGAPKEGEEPTTDGG